MQRKVYDVLVAGSGVAGMYAALCLPSDLNILLLSKYDQDISSSNLAQGGVAAVLSFEDDSFDLHYNDTLIAGRYENDPDAVDTLVREGPARVRDIMTNMEVEFDRNENGELDKTLEGGHCRRRIVHYKDTTGAELVRKLSRKLSSSGNIEVSLNTTLYDLTEVKSGFRADLLIGAEPVSIFASYVILATGGIGRMYKYTTNPKSATGDGIRIAYNLGAKIKNLSFVQFHPTAFNSPDGEQFLVSESVRGEGAYLLNCNKERFMQNYDERLELAPRDVVSHSIILESRKTNSDEFWLDIRHEDPEFIKERFPGIRAGCLKYGVDIAYDLIPIYPCQHYLMGGIKTDINGRTTVNRLYAAGECACTGVHGKNRLASNSLLEALVFSKRAADDITACIKAGYPKVQERQSNFCYDSVKGKITPQQLRTEVQTLMQQSYFVIPDYNAAVIAKKRIDEIRRELMTGGYAITTDYCETLSITTAAHIILSETTL